MPHLVLLGDSIFDNARYTSGGPDVVSQVRKFLPSGWSASLLAIDGSTTDNIDDQIQHLPQEATHLVLSVGGNNALMHASSLGISLFGIPGTSTAGALESLADISNDFETRYRTAVDACLRPRLPISVCTIYNGCFPDRAYQRIASVALAIFNDVILRVAIEHGLPVIDLRLVCTAPRDYANPIEPSSVGGEKIARVIATLVTAPDAFTRGATIVGAFHSGSDA
jgi:hypothetical protein